MDTVQQRGESEPLYIYFNWDGSFNWLEDYTFTVDTSRDPEGQQREYFNLKDYYNIQDFEVFVNYIRFRVNTVDTNGNPVQYLFYEGDAVVESSAGTSFILNNQSIQFNDNGTPEDTSDDSYDIAIGRRDINSILDGYIKNDPSATVDIIGIQLFVAHRGKMMDYWYPHETPEHSVYRDGMLSLYALYDPSTMMEVNGRERIVGSDKTIVSYEVSKNATQSSIPQKRFSQYNGTEVTDFSDYLGLIKVFYALSNEELAGETIYLNQSKIEYSGGSKVPKFGMALDKNSEAEGNYVYFSLPIQANTISIYEDNDFNKHKSMSIVPFDFLIFIRLKEPNNIAAWEMSGLYYTHPILCEIREDENGPFEYCIGGDSEDYTSQFFGRETPPKDLLAIYSVRYNEDIIDLLTGEKLLDPRTGEPFRVNLASSVDWVYQGNIPILLPEGITSEDIIMTEISSYAFINYNFEISTLGYQSNIYNFKYLDTTPVIRRDSVQRVLRYYYTIDITERYWGEVQLFPYRVRIAGRHYTFNGETIIGEHYETILHGQKLTKIIGDIQMYSLSFSRFPLEETIAGSWNFYQIRVPGSEHTTIGVIDIVDFIYLLRNNRDDYTQADIEEVLALLNIVKK
jgi:hypothetical protein